MSSLNSPIGLTASQSLMELNAEIQTILKGNKMSEQKIASGWAVAKIEISKTEGDKDNRKRVSVGNISLPYPTIAAFKQAVDECSVDKDASAISKENPEGIVVYSHQEPAIADVANWLQSAINGKVRIKGTNMLVGGTAELMNGKSFPTSFEELLEPGERGGEFLKLRAEAVTAFAAFVGAQGKSQAVVDGFKAMFRQPDTVLAHQPAKYKEKMQEYLTGFASSLSKENLERYGKILVSVEDAAKLAVSDDEMLA